MACLYGCFIGFGSAITLQANLTALAARRCVTPTHKLKLILSEQISSFAFGYMDVIILIIYLRYILKLDFQGQIGKMLVVSFLFSEVSSVYPWDCLSVALEKCRKVSRVADMLGIPW